MMNRFFLFSAMGVLMALSANRANAYDFSAANGDGQTIYYNITSSVPPLEVEVTSNYEDVYSGNIVIPGTVTRGVNTYTVRSIEEGTFAGCRDLTSITIPNTVTIIGGYAFALCKKLTAVIIPSSVTFVGEAAFSGCSKLTSINVESGNLNYISVGGVLFDISQDTLIQYPAGKTGNYTIPNTVTIIGDNAFIYCGELTDVTIPNTVTVIGDYAFAFCEELTDVTIPNSVIILGESAFAECYGLTSVTIGNSVTTIGEYAFSYCEELTSVTIPHSVITIGNDAFFACRGLTSVTIGNSVTTIGVYAFSYCEGLTSVTIPNSVTFIGDDAFNSCRGLTSIVIPNSVTFLGEGAFAECSGLTSVIIGDSLTAIQYMTFYECTGLTSLTIGSSVTSIGEMAFIYCSQLAEIRTKAINPPRLDADALLGAFSTIPVYVPCDRKIAYENAPGWNYFTNIIEDCNKIDELSLENQLTIFPNPATDNIHISLPENVQAVFTLYDMQGKALIYQQVNNQETVSVNHLAGGIYVYHVRTGKQSYQGKIIKK